MPSQKMEDSTLASMDDILLGAAYLFFLSARLTDLNSIMSLSASSVMRTTNLSINDVNTLQLAVAHLLFQHEPSTAFAILNSSESHPHKRLKLSTGCDEINSLLRGGMISQCITEVVGASATGKTQLCMQLCLTVQLPQTHGGLNSGAVYVCTEDAFPNKRLMQMAERLKLRFSDPDSKDLNFTDHIFIEHAAELDDLRFCIYQKIPILLSRGQIKLIVIDSIAALFRCEFPAQDAHKRAKIMSAFAAQLHRLATEFNIPVVCVNQVSAVVSDTDCSSSSISSERKLSPALGIAWSNLVTTRLLLSRTSRSVTLTDKDHALVQCSANHIPVYQTNVRTIEVIFAPHLPSLSCQYIIDGDGVKGLH